MPCSRCSLSRSVSAGLCARTGRRVVGRSTPAGLTSVRSSELTRVDFPAPVEPATTTIAGAESSVSRGITWSSSWRRSVSRDSSARSTPSIESGNVVASTSRRRSRTASRSVSGTAGRSVETVAAATVSTERPAVPLTLLDAVRDLRRDVDATTFPLSIEGVERAEESRLTLRRQLDDHVIPRLTELSAPAIVVVAGSTGAGKSTLVNSLLRTEVSPAGVLRPTTRRPVLAHNPADTDLLNEHRLHGIVTMVSHDQVPRGLALLDAPDLDSVLETNRDMADRLLEAADLWLFVTTAARYGDALPWRVLERAASREASVAMVLNRVSTESVMEIRMDLMMRLREHGMTNVPLFVVPDQGPHEGLLQERAVAPINRWLGMLAGPDHGRAVILRTLRGALHAVLPWVDELIDHVDAQVDARVALEAMLAAALVPPADAAAAAMVHGTVGACWSQLTVPGGQLDTLFTRSGRIRRSARRGRDRSEALAPLIDDIQASVTSSLTAAGGYAEAAARDALVGPSAPGGGDSV